MSEATTFVKILLTSIIVMLVVTTAVTTYNYATRTSGRQLFKIDAGVSSSLESELIEIMGKSNPSLPIPSILSMIDRNVSYINNITIKVFVNDTITPAETVIFNKQNNNFISNNTSLMYYLKDYFSVKGGLEVSSADNNTTFNLTVLVRRKN